MIYSGIEVFCPRCQGELEHRTAASRDELSCANCEAKWPIIAGIADLRVFSDPYIEMEADREKAWKLAELLDRLSFHELVAHYYRTTSVVPECDAQRYTAGLLAAPDRARATLHTWEQLAESGADTAACDMLELGCGTAPLLVTAAGKYRQVVGIDIALRWLVVGKKRLAEAGINIPLLCACAEALPFKGGQFDRVMAESTIENVADQPRVLLESHRVLRSGGFFFASTPNRGSLGPDPHVSGIWAGGWWSKSRLDEFVRRRGGIPPKRNLLSVGRLIRMSRHAGFERRRIALPDFAPQQRQQVRGLLRLLVHLYQILKRVPGCRQLLFLIGPMFHLVAEKQPCTSAGNADAGAASNHEEIRSQVVAS